MTDQQEIEVLKKIHEHISKAMNYAFILNDQKEYYKLLRIQEEISFQIGSLEYDLVHPF